MHCTKDSRFGAGDCRPEICWYQSFSCPALRQTRESPLIECLTHRSGCAYTHTCLSASFSPVGFLVLNAGIAKIRLREHRTCIHMRCTSVMQGSTVVTMLGKRSSRFDLFLCMCARSQACMRVCIYASMQRHVPYMPIWGSQA